MPLTVVLPNVFGILLMVLLGIRGVWNTFFYFGLVSVKFLRQLRFGSELVVLFGLKKRASVRIL